MAPSSSSPLAGGNDKFLTISATLPGWFCPAGRLQWVYRSAGQTAGPDGRGRSSVQRCDDSNRRWAGFYGDGHCAPGPILLASGARLLGLRGHLAELTLAILQKDRQRDESLGYTRDLPLYVASAVPYLLDGQTKFITNACRHQPDRRPAGRWVECTAGRRCRRIDGGPRWWEMTSAPTSGPLGLPPTMRCSPTPTWCCRTDRRSARRPGAHIVITGRVADALRCSLRRWCTDTGGPGTDWRTASRRASRPDICWSAPAR